MSVVWIWGFANLLVELLQIIGLVANLSLEFLGLTFLGLGNTMPGTLPLDLARHLDGDRPIPHGTFGNGVDGLCGRAALWHSRGTWRLDAPVVLDCRR